MINIDTTAEVLKGLEKGVEAGEFVRFDPAAGIEQLTPEEIRDSEDAGIDLDTVDLDTNVEEAPAGSPSHGRNLRSDAQPASTRQIKFITDLAQERDIPEEVIEQARDHWRKGLLGSGLASLTIERFLTYPKKVDRSAAGTAEAPEGMHKLEGTIYKVQRAVHGSGHLYAKRLELAQYIEEGQARYHGTFTYAPGAARLLSEDTLLTLEEAREFGAVYGTCAVCGRTLTNENSIEAGIGPVCAERF